MFTGARWVRKAWVDMGDIGSLIKRLLIGDVLCSFLLLCTRRGIA